MKWIRGMRRCFAGAFNYEKPVLLGCPVMALKGLAL